MLVRNRSLSKQAASSRCSWYSSSSTSTVSTHSFLILRWSLSMSYSTCPWSAWTAIGQRRTRIPHLARSPLSRTWSQPVRLYGQHYGRGGGMLYAKINCSLSFAAHPSPRAHSQPALITSLHERLTDAGRHAQLWVHTFRTALAPSVLAVIALRMVVFMFGLQLVKSLRGEVFDDDDDEDEDHGNVALRHHQIPLYGRMSYSWSIPSSSPCSPNPTLTISIPWRVRVFGDGRMHSLLSHSMHTL